MTSQLSLRPGTVTVLGFGGRTPVSVLELLASSSSTSSSKPEGPIGLADYSIQLHRSDAFSYALLQPPYRRFLQTNISTNTVTTSNKPAILIYQLPSSWIEFVRNNNNNSEEVEFVRKILLSLSEQKNDTIVLMFDTETGSWVVGDNNNNNNADSLLQKALQGDVSARMTLARCAGQRLARIESEAMEYGLRETKDVVIVVGAGGREHALAVALAQSPTVGRVVCCPGNGGTALEHSQGNTKICNIGSNQENSTVIELCQQLKATMVVVGPEIPLVDGIVDQLAVDCPDVLVFGPTQAAAQLEASKAFCKDFLQEHNIPTAAYRNFTVVDEAVAYVKSLEIDTTGRRQVVKASGLAAGKGVLLPTNEAETIQAIYEVMSDKAFGRAGDTCVIESFLTGPEASCLAFCDGTTARLLPAAQDHKRALDNDEGLNTGGMGAYAPAPCVTPALHCQIEQMCQLTVTKMAERGTPYTGILYAGMILTQRDGPYVLEFNCRFGDPETQVLLPLLETDLYEVLTACCRGLLNKIDVRIRSGQSAATVVCAAAGYPMTYPKGMRVKGLENISSMVPNAKVYHAGTKLENNVPRCTGGRVLAVTGIGASLSLALKVAYVGVEQLDFVQDDDTERSLLHRRTDIGHKAVMDRKLRIGVMGSTRGTALIPVMQACEQNIVPAEIVAVLSNKASAPILEKGAALGGATFVQAVSSQGLSRSRFDAECTALLLDAGTEYVLMVGYMRIVSKEFCDFWKRRCINVHPSLLPKHAGGMDLAVHQAVLDAHETESGCTIHEVTEDVDGGPIVVQKRVMVESNETAETLKAKIQPMEGPAFVEAIQLYCRGKAISYSDAGVSIDAGNKLVDLIKPLCKATRRPGCDADLGGFGGLFDLSAAGYDSSDTVLIGATDGVGTKLKIAHLTGKHYTVGIDLVAMCVNDLIVAGGEPLFFLDYFATGKLKVDEAAKVVEGIAEGCKQSACGLIGGETAEMPSMYAPGDYDLAGFSVGAVHRDRILPRNVSVGDILLGISSSGIHSNGFSLVRKLIEKEGLSYDGPCPWDLCQPTLGDALMVPTKIYVKACLPLIQRGLLHGLAHITGGGLLENLPRSIPEGVAAEISNHPPLLPVFKWMQKVSGLDDAEMLRTFNCGVGMVLILPADNLPNVRDLLASTGETEVFEMGVLVEGHRQIIMKTVLV